MPITGDITAFKAVEKRGVTLHNFPQVLAADIADKTNIINVASQSGKRLGGQVMVVDSYTDPTEAAIYVASGNADVSKWIVVKIVLGTGQATVTPA